MKSKNLVKSSITAAIAGITCFSVLTAPLASFAEEEGPFYIVEHDVNTDAYWKGDQVSTFETCRIRIKIIDQGRANTPSGKRFDVVRGHTRMLCVTEAELADYTFEN